MSWKGELREMSEPHDFDSADFKAGDFNVGAQYEISSIVDKGLTGTIVAKDETKGELAEKGWRGALEDVS